MPAGLPAGGNVLAQGLFAQVGAAELVLPHDIQRGRFARAYLAFTWPKGI